jgi:hypothetical protein
MKRFSIPLTLIASIAGASSAHADQREAIQKIQGAYQHYKRKQMERRFLDDIRGTLLGARGPQTVANRLTSQVYKDTKLDPIETLPFELTSTILGYLDPRGYCAAAQVNQNWNAQSQDPFVTESVFSPAVEQVFNKFKDLLEKMDPFNVNDHTEGLKEAEQLLKLWSFASENARENMRCLLTQLLNCSSVRSEKRILDFVHNSQDKKFIPAIVSNVSSKNSQLNAFRYLFKRNPENRELQSICEQALQFKGENHRSHAAISLLQVNPKHLRALRSFDGFLASQKISGRAAEYHAADLTDLFVKDDPQALAILVDEYNHNPNSEVSRAIRKILQHLHRIVQTPIPEGVESEWRKNSEEFLKKFDQSN